MRANLTATFLTARAFLREVERNGHGSLVMISSTAGEGVAGTLGRGYLTPGEGDEADLHFPAPTDEGPSPFEIGEAYGMWWCHDVRGDAHFWSTEGHYRHFPEGHLFWKRAEPYNAKDVFERFFPFDLPDEVQLVPAPRPALEPPPDRVERRAARSTLPRDHKSFRRAATA